MKLIRNFFAAIGCLTLILALSFAAWWYRDDLRAWWSDRNRVEAMQPSPELAAAAEEKLEALVAGRGPEEVRLNEMELQSFVVYRMADQLPPGIGDPNVALGDSTLSLSVALDLVILGQSVPAAVELRRFFGDSARVNTEVYPHLAEDGLGRITVLSLQAGLVPVPALLIPNLLARTGFETEGRTLVVPLPPGLRGMRIQGEELIVSRER